MVQGPNDIEGLLAANLQYTPPQQQPRKQAVPPQANELVQAPDTVQLSHDAVQAAAGVRQAEAHAANATPPVNTGPAFVPQAQAVIPPAAPVAPGAVTKPVNPAVPVNGTVPVAPARPTNVVAAVARAAQALQGEAEVRPTAVQNAVANLGNLGANNPAVNAQVAQKLLTGI
jgi:hypothetical protein